MSKNEIESVKKGRGQIIPTTAHLRFYLKWNLMTWKYLKLESDMMCFAYLKGHFGGCVENRIQNKKTKQQNVSLEAIP